MIRECKAPKNVEPAPATVQDDIKGALGTEFSDAVLFLGMYTPGDRHRRYLRVTTTRRYCDGINDTKGHAADAVVWYEIVDRADYFQRKDRESVTGDPAEPVEP